MAHVGSCAPAPHGGASPICWPSPRPIPALCLPADPVDHVLQLLHAAHKGLGQQAQQGGVPRRGASNPKLQAGRGGVVGEGSAGCGHGCGLCGAISG